MHRSNRQIKSHGQKIALRMSQGENVLEELDALEASKVSQDRPGRISDATTIAAPDITVRNPSNESIATANPPQLDAHQHTTSSAPMRNERPPAESSRRASWAATETAVVALMLCELKTATTTTALEDSSAFVTPSIP